MEKVLYVVRHCQAEGQSPHDQLTEKGRLQAETLIRFFSTKPIDRIISSPYLHARDTALQIAQSKRLHVEEDSRLSERILGNRNFEDWLVKLEDSFLDLHLKYEGGESSIEAMTRVSNVVNAISGCSRTLLVTHGILMTLLLRYFDERFGFKEWQALSCPDAYLIRLEGEASQIEHIWQEPFSNVSI